MRTTHQAHQEQQQQCCCCKNNNDTTVSTTTHQAHQEQQQQHYNIINKTTRMKEQQQQHQRYEMRTTHQAHQDHNMSDSDFGFDGGQSDSDFGYDETSSSSNDEEVINATPVDEDILVEAQIDSSSGDDDIIATAEIVTRKQCRCRYMIQEKLMILCQVRQRMNNGASQHSVCNSININRKLIHNWNKQFPQLIDAMNNKAKCLCKGMQSCLFPFSDSLLFFIFELREQGMAVNTSMILMKAAKISRQFCERSREAQISCVQRFVKAQGLVHRLGTHKSQKAPEETQTEALDFMGVICPKLQLQCQSKAFILIWIKLQFHLHSILNRLWKLWVQEQSMYASLQMIQNRPQLPSL